MIGKFVDVEIVDVYPNSVRGVLLRTEDQMALRTHESPDSVIARTRKEERTGRGHLLTCEPHAHYHAGAPRRCPGCIALIVPQFTYNCLCP